MRYTTSSPRSFLQRWTLGSATVLVFACSPSQQPQPKAQVEEPKASNLVSTWDWNGIKLGMDAAQAREFLARICPEPPKYDAPVGYFKTTTLTCHESTREVAGRKVEVTLYIYDGKVVTVDYRLDAPGDEWRMVVRGALEKKFGSGKESTIPMRSGDVYSVEWQPDPSLSVALSYWTGFHAAHVQYTDASAYSRRAAEQASELQKKTNEAAKGI